MTQASKDTPVLALESRYYTDPAIFAQEKERIFFRTWQFACHASQVAKPGDYVTFKIADQNLFVIRDRDDELRCFYNVCQHRAHELLSGAGNKKTIVCPYHAWTYQTDGRLRGAPNASAVPGFDAAKICLQPVRLEVLCGFVFVNLDPAADSMETWFPGAEADLRRFVPAIDSYKPILEHSADEACNWKVAVENYNECYHCKLVHPSFTKGVIAADTVDIVPNGHTLRHSAQGVATDDASYGFTAADSGYNVIFFWPSLSIQIYPGGVVNTYWWRFRSVAETVVYRGWLTEGGVEDAETLKVAEIDRTTTFAEDLPILDSVQRGLASRGYDAGPLVLDPKGGVNNELSVYSIHQWVRAALAE